jgi:hypothetical protein
MVNLAADSNAHQALILSLNDKLNALIETEIGVDDGSYYPKGQNYKLEASA